MRRVTSNNNDKIGVDNYLTMVALEDEFQASLSVNVCEYCIDGDGLWKSLPAGELTVTIKKGQMVSFRASLTPTSSNGVGTFSATKFFNVKGNCMSLLYGDEGKNRTYLPNYAFLKLFYKNEKIISSKELLLTASRLSSQCYRSLFSSCKSLVDTPKLPATTLAHGCYYTMFSGCTSLTTAPELPATTLAQSCYAYMFNGCTSLTTTPELPAKMLEQICYGGMFSGCISLTVAPDLPAETLTNNCYYELFKGCSGISHIRMIATNISASNSLSSWVSGVAPSGTFIKAKGVEIQSGTSGIPNGWTVIEE